MEQNKKLVNVLKEIELDSIIRVRSLSTEANDAQQKKCAAEDQISVIKSKNKWFEDEQLMAEYDILSAEVERYSKRITECQKQLDAEIERQKKLKGRNISPDTLASCGTTIVCTLMVIGAEYAGMIMRSKGFSLIPKPRL